MINGKVDEYTLNSEKFTIRELYDAAQASPWMYAVESVESSHQDVNLGFAVRWLAEWIVQNKREHLEVGEIYEDVNGHRYLLYGSGDNPWLSLPDNSGRQVSSWVTDQVVIRPLQKLVPENKAEHDAAVPPKRM